MIDNAILFCVPYAGGSSKSISNVTCLINTDGLDIQCLELPGRGMRSKEPFVSSIGEAMNDLYEKVKSRLQNPHQPIIFWGHSLGALLALLLTHKFHQDGYNISGLIVSGMKAPLFVESFSKNAVKKHRDSLFSEMMPLKKQSNKQSPLFQRVHKKGMEIMERDIAILENNDMKNWTEIIIEKPLTVLIGEQDELFPTLEYYNDWKLHTTDTTHYYSISGGHLFVMQHPVEVAALISQVITNIILN